jgi:ribosomal protein S18 acetylase RimI-like enzyme
VQITFGGTYCGAVTIIRTATLQDLPGAYRVCLLTGDAGRDATRLFRNPELLGHVFVGPYLVGQPDLASVVVDDDGVAGYGLAAADTRAFEQWTETNWWPTLRADYPVRTDGSAEAELIASIHAPALAADDLLDEYPSHLHLDLVERVRGQGYGRRLIERVLAQLREGGSSGVHFHVASSNANAVEFYRHLGFGELERRTDSIVMGVRL